MRAIIKAGAEKINPTRHGVSVRVWKKSLFSTNRAPQTECLHEGPTKQRKERSGAESYLFGKSPFAMKYAKPMMLAVVVASKAIRTPAE